MIVNIRGTSGSGKSTLVRQLMDSFAQRATVKDGPGTELDKDVGYLCTEHSLLHPAVTLGVVGMYRTACGGCDQIKTQDEVCRLVREFSARFNHVVFEGLLITGNYARYKTLAEELGLERFVFAFLDTPFEVCCERINARRAEKGKGPLLDHSNTRAKWDASRTVAKKYEADGLNVVWLDHRYPLMRVLELLT